MHPSLLSRISGRRHWLATGLCVGGLCGNLTAGPLPKLYPVATLPLAVATSSEGTNSPEPGAAELTNEVVQAGLKIESIPQPASGPTNGLPADLAAFQTKNKNLSAQKLSEEERLSAQQKKLELARYLRNSRQSSTAEPLFVELLAEDVPETIRQTALLELAAVAQDENNPAKAQQIYAQFISKWPNDLRIPEVLLRQGLLFRQMGMNNLALAKFYSVMTSALVLKNDQLAYYVRLVHQAQVEIAETHYALGKYTEAAEFFTRLLKQTNSENKAALLYKLARCHSAIEKFPEAIAASKDFLTRYPNAPEQPEVRFLLAHALKQLGRNNESLEQVLTLLKEQRDATKDRPAVWTYWQQRAGNLIGNHLYSEGEYAKALEVYLSLSELDPSPEWRLPVSYQVAMTYERLWQPAKAAEVYSNILKREPELAEKASPSLKSVFEMARWRMNFVNWHNRAEDANRRFHPTPATNAPVALSQNSETPVVQ